MLRRQILGLLSQGRRHGYALAKEHRERTRIFKGSGNFYRELKTLCSLDMIRVVHHPGRPDPQKVVYEISPKGSKDLERWLTSVPPISGCSESELAARAAFLPLVAADTLDSLLNEWESNIRDALRRLEETRATPETPSSRSRIGNLLVDRRTQHLILELKFVGELRVLMRPQPNACAVAAQPAGRAPSRNPTKRPR